MSVKEKLCSQVFGDRWVDVWVGATHNACSHSLNGRGIKNKSTVDRVPMLGRLCKYEEYLSTNGKVMVNIKVIQ